MLHNSHWYNHLLAVIHAKINFYLAMNDSLIQGSNMCSCVDFSEAVCVAILYPGLSLQLLNNPLFLTVP